MNCLIFFFFYILWKTWSSSSSSSFPWPGVVIGYLRRLSPDQFLPHIWFESRRGINSCLSSFLYRSNHRRCPPTWRFALVMDTWPFTPSGEPFARGPFKELSVQRCCMITTMAAYISRELILLHWWSLTL